MPPVIEISIDGPLFKNAKPKSKQINLFDYAFDHILEVEGKESDDPDDAGGWTRYGISERFLKDANLPVDIEITPAVAREIYRKHFWIAGMCGVMPPIIALCHFDAMVNHRPRRATWLLQKGLGVKADSVIGPNTMKATVNVDQFQFWQRYIKHRYNFYWSISEDSTNAKYTKGWGWRLILLTGKLYELEQIISENLV